MMSRILAAFSAPRPAPLPEPDNKLALGALLVRVAKSDRVYRVEEIARIDHVLARLYALNPVEAARMRATCEKLERAAPETDRFAMLIRDTVDREVRIAALGALWEVALADGADDPAETAVIDAARHAMGLTEAETAAARSLAAGGAQ